MLSGFRSQVSSHCPQLQGLGRVYSNHLAALHGERRRTNAVLALFRRGLSVPVRSVSPTATPSGGFAAVTVPAVGAHARTVTIDAAHNPARASAQLALT